MIVPPVKRNFPPSTRDEYVNIARPDHTPEWAITFMINILEEVEFDGIIYLVWKDTPKRALSGGSTFNFVGDYPNRTLRLVPEIHIRAGTDFVDQTHVLLHEVAHALYPDPIRGHGKSWATGAWQLYRHFGTEHFSHHALREALYKPTALRAPGAPSARDLIDAWGTWPYRSTKLGRNAEIIGMFSDMLRGEQQHGAS